MARALQTLDFDSIVEINHGMIEEFGGEPIAPNHNIMNRSTLEYALGTTQGVLLGAELFPTVVDRAASLAWHIIMGHPFVDGNKRTGLEAARIFLELNGFVLPIDDEAKDTGVQVARDHLSLEEFTEWMRTRVNPGGA